MISAFDVYLVLQLDSIKAALAVLFIFIGLFTVGAGVIGGVTANSHLESERVLSKSALHKSKLAAVVFVVGLLFVSLVPSSKTVAAMLILPALTSDNVVNAVKPELKELYDLTKQAMRGLAEPGKAEK